MLGDFKVREHDRQKMNGGRIQNHTWVSTPKNIEYIDSTVASGCQHAIYCNICRGWRGSTFNILSIFARCGKEPDRGQYLEQYLLPEQSKIAQKSPKLLKIARS